MKKTGEENITHFKFCARLFVFEGEREKEGERERKEGKE